MFLEILLLIVIAVLLWMLHSTVDGFNEDLQQLRILVGHIERYMAEQQRSSAGAASQKKLSLSTDKQTVKASQSLININSANKTSLTSLPKIGAATAEKIIAGRPYSKLEEIKERAAISEDVYKLLKDKISL